MSGKFDIGPACSSSASGESGSGLLVIAPCPSPSCSSPDIAIVFCRVAAITLISPGATALGLNSVSLSG